ncbi:ubiquitin-like protein [Marseillevirus marseillevirus]|uniref:Ubiquitin-like protein n=1 Tax=Marseillevirus marseillevirus TaxID=694581 RepID=D2XB42_GBMV|nr:ubiquitin-like protein [Marseillevirus marseillevirus]ADB04169.1 ubiquitin-like protein [Marseillevirus marseillevirus]
MLQSQEAQRIRGFLSRKFPDRIALIFFPLREESYLSKEKFIIHKTTSFAHTMAEVRKYCPEGKTLYVVSEKKRAPLLMTKNVGELAREHSDDENILCLFYSEESTFG